MRAGKPCQPIKVSRLGAAKWVSAARVAEKKIDLNIPSAFQSKNGRLVKNGTLAIRAVPLRIWCHLARGSAVDVYNQIRKSGAIKMANCLNARDMLNNSRLNHFFRGKDDGDAGDQIFFQGHASPGIYARAFLEGRLTQEQLENFRRELNPAGGLSSYPHPWLMPGFWEFPTVSMGLGPIMAIYQARFNRYLEDRGLKKKNGTNLT